MLVQIAQTLIVGFRSRSQGIRASAGLQLSNMKEVIPISGLMCLTLLNRVRAFFSKPLRHSIQSIVQFQCAFRFFRCPR